MSARANWQRRAQRNLRRWDKLERLNRALNTLENPPETVSQGFWVGSLVALVAFVVGFIVRGYLP